MEQTWLAGRCGRLALLFAMALCLTACATKLSSTAGEMPAVLWAKPKPYLYDLQIDKTELKDIGFEKSGMPVTLNRIAAAFRTSWERVVVLEASTKDCPLFYGFVSLLNKGGQNTLSRRDCNVHYDFSRIGDSIIAVQPGAADPYRFSYTLGHTTPPMTGAMVQAEAQRQAAAQEAERQRQAAAREAERQRQAAAAAAEQEKRAQAERDAVAQAEQDRVDQAQRDRDRAQAAERARAVEAAMTPAERHAAAVQQCRNGCSFTCNGTNIIGAGLAFHAFGGGAIGWMAASDEKRRCQRRGEECVARCDAGGQ